MAQNNEIAVSVAVITYNMQGYLPQLLDSILKQKVNFRYEIVVDDDHSPDDSRQILLDYAARYPGRFVLSLRDTNVGGSRNMYGVLRQCRGKYIAILEGDDWWEAEDKLQYQYDFMETHPEYVGMYCNSWCELSRTESIQKVRRDITEPMIFSYRDFQSYHFFDRLPNTTDTAFFRNFFATAPEREVDVFYKAHRMVWDQSLALILPTITRRSTPGRTTGSPTPICTPVTRNISNRCCTDAAAGSTRCGEIFLPRPSGAPGKTTARRNGKRPGRSGTSGKRNGP